MVFLVVNWLLRNFTRVGAVSRQNRRCVGCNSSPDYLDSGWMNVLQCVAVRCSVSRAWWLLFISDALDSRWISHGSTQTHGWFMAHIWPDWVMWHLTRMLRCPLHLCLSTLIYIYTHMYEYIYRIYIYVHIYMTLWAWRRPGKEKEEEEEEEKGGCWGVVIRTMMCVNTRCLK